MFFNGWAAGLFRALLISNPKAAWTFPNSSRRFGKRKKRRCSACFGTPLLLPCKETHRSKHPAGQLISVEAASRIKRPFFKHFVATSGVRRKPILFRFRPPGSFKRCDTRDFALLTLATLSLANSLHSAPPPPPQIRPPQTTESSTAH